MSFKGNPEHLKVLHEALEKKDLSIWNEFNYNLLKIGQIFNKKVINLVRTILEGADLEKAYLGEVTLQGANEILYLSFDKPEYAKKLNKSN